MRLNTYLVGGFKTHTHTHRCTYVQSNTLIFNPANGRMLPTYIYIYLLHVSGGLKPPQAARRRTEPSLPSADPRKGTGWNDIKNHGDFGEKFQNHFFFYHEQFLRIWKKHLEFTQKWWSHPEIFRSGTVGWVCRYSRHQLSQSNLVTVATHNGEVTRT